MLTSTYSEEEIWQALKDMGPAKASGEDGFPALFFQKYQSIIGKDVVTFCLNILNKGMDFDSLNVTNIVLILKISYPTNLRNFRPISLCNILYKVINKMIVNRFKIVLNQCNDNAQSAFVSSRLISDNMLLTYKILHTYRQKRIRKKGYGS